MDLKIFSDCIDWASQDQIYTLAKQEPFMQEKIRIMPDCHAGIGCVVGFTSTMSDKVIPNVIGVDIGCGMRVAELGQIEVDFAELDKFVKARIPSGMDVNRVGDEKSREIVKNLLCKKQLKDISRLECSLGTLGGGNHFIEVDRGQNGLYLVVHTGSRNLGKQVATHYQNLAIKRTKFQSDAEKAEVVQMVESLKAAGRQADIPDEMEKIKNKHRQNTAIPKALCYLSGDDMLAYMHDMRLCQQFAVQNRTAIVNKILAFLGVSRCNVWESIHNYIDENNVIRKGAIAAHLGQRVIIPMNMRDGCLIGIGKGNPDWNESAPHGAGRIMSRSEAKRNLSVDEFAKQMQGVYTTTANISTLDESPMAYKPMEEILKYIDQTVEVEQVIKPLYNFKAGDE